MRLEHQVEFSVHLPLTFEEAVAFARDVPRSLSHADFLADLQVVNGQRCVVNASIPVSAAMFGQRELPFSSALEPTPDGARLVGMEIAPSGPGWALVGGEARVVPGPTGSGTRIDYAFDIEVRLKLPPAERWGQRALTRMVEFTARTVLAKVASELPRAVERSAGVADRSGDPSGALG